ncbi:isocitrate lyase/phosphoenolpyruvate mutase family protein [Streptomyces sp. NPDC056227]|uniref:isocitrate lyase/phosphoenolpyruvate mutase family protein n=1 Tax=Streptomyces sp. NPDC056227 TaxID=3345753 RepID=UPI0035D7A2A9
MDIVADLPADAQSAEPVQPIRGFDEAVNRVRSAVNAAKGRNVVTGRTDNFIQGRPDLDDTIRRLTAFAEVGADVVYAPFPPDLDALVAIVTAVAPTPVNVLISPANKVLTARRWRSLVRPPEALLRARVSGSSACPFSPGGRVVNTEATRGRSAGRWA